MENVKIIFENGMESNVNGLFYIFDSKYYFIYTNGEIDENDYVKLYVVQVCKEIKNTSNGTVDTGFMLGLEITNPEEWSKVQSSITKIVEDKKEGTQNPDIQYLPISMLVNLKVVSKNNFKLMKRIVEDNFNVNIAPSEINVIGEMNNGLGTNVLEQKVELQNPISISPQETQLAVPVNESPSIEAVNPIMETELEKTPELYQENIVINSIQPLPLSLLENSSQSIVNESTVGNNDLLDKIDNDLSNQLESNIPSVQSEIGNDVIIDYRTKFFEEQQKNQILEAEIKELKEKIEQIKKIIG